MHRAIRSDPRINWICNPVHVSFVHATLTRLTDTVYCNAKRYSFHSPLTCIEHFCTMTL
ncbi:hypothetical protein N9P82_01030 [bacterium]|nr:hypothetical protein [bacterium]